MKDNKEFIEGIYDKYDEYLKEQKNPKFTQVKNITDKDFGKKKSFVKGGFYKVLSAAAVFAIVVSGVVISNNYIKNQTINDDNTQKVAQTTTTEKISLNTVNDFETFYKIIKDNYKETRGNNEIYDITNDLGDATTKSSGIVPSDMAKSEALDAQSTNSSNSATTQTPTTNDYSKTNIQVENVDEADIVKTNGKYIFYVVSNKLLIVDTQNQDKMEKVAEISFQNDDFKPTELYINQDKVILLGNESGYSYSNNIVKETISGIYKKGIYKQKAVAVVYNVSKITEPKEERRIEIEGKYVSSRMIDNNIYFIANKSIAAYDIVKYDIEDLNENIYKPAYKDTAFSRTQNLIDFDKIYYYDNIENLNYLTIGGFSLDAKNEADVKTFLGAGEDVYCSDQNMYVVKSKNVYDADTRRSFGKDTKILKFNLNNGKISFKAEADVDGGINNQFSMDENNGYFRIATTIGKTYNMDNSTSNSLYVLDENLKEVGRLDGIAKGEKIFSVRYAGDKAYVVTFKEIDPLFVIDLSNVRNPKILGELKIPGYSTYLHPYDETHLIGFGYDTKPNASNTGTVNDGLKMSMFDITDFTNPKEMFTIKIGDNRTSSPLTNNHKALLFSKEKNLIAFPVTSYSNEKSEYKAQVYDIDLNKGFTLRGEIEHKEDVATTQKYYSNYKLNIDRIIYSNNIFYTLSKGLIKASNMDSLQEVSKLNIE